MPLDPNIILQGRGVQLDNPLDVANKALTMKQLSQSTQRNGQVLADEQALRDAYKQNTSVGADGKASLNRGGVANTLSSLGRGDLAMDAQNKMGQQDMEKLTEHAKIAKQLAFSITDAPSYEYARQQGIKMGLPRAETLPAEFDPNFVKQMQMGTLSAEEQLGNYWKEREMQIKEHEAKTKARDVGVKAAEGAGKMTEAQSKALGFGRRAMISDQMLEKVSNDPNFDVTSLKTQARMALPKWMGGIKDPREQAMMTAKLGFIASVVRKESGAAVTPVEFETYSKIYYPQPGDGEQALQDKKTLRANFIDTEKLTAGPAWKDPIPLTQVKPKGQTQTAGAPPPMKVGAIEDGHRFKGGDPGNQANWEKVK